MRVQRNYESFFFLFFLFLENIIYIEFFKGRSFGDALGWKKRRIEKEDFCHSDLIAYDKHRISYHDSDHFTVHATKI